MENLLVASYEDKVRTAFIPNEKDTVVDVGAHLGEYTLAVARSTLKVLAIEPNPDTLTLLRENLRLNRISNVVIINTAVYDSVGSCSLFVLGDRTGMGSLVLKYEDDAAAIEVMTDTLDNILSDLGVSTIDWLKVDVEGAEMHVLRGARKTLTANRDHIRLIIESHTDENTVLIRQMLEEQFGLRCEMLDKNHIFAKLE
jgi:FkbM family methyltransferase